VHENHPPIYLDHAATSWPKPPEVAEAMVQTFDSLTANAGRSGHRASLDSARMVFGVRLRLAELFGVRNSENLIFVRGCTEGLNLVLKGWLRPGDRVVVSPLEHNAVMRPLARLTRELSLSISTLPADPWGRIDWDGARRLEENQRQPPALVVVAHASNVNGAVQDIRQAKTVFPASPLLVDAAQTAGVLPIDVEQLRIDFLSASVHKGLLGPTGVGVVYLSPRFDVRPLIEGGTGSRSEDQYQPEFLPDRFESGTPNIAGIAGLSAGLDYILARGLSDIRACESGLAHRLIEGLTAIEGVTVYGTADTQRRTAAVSFRIAGTDNGVAVSLLSEQFDIMCRAGLHCAPRAHKTIGTFPGGTVRLSIGPFNTAADIDAALSALKTIARK